jgi:hypothetical protein
VSGWIPPRGAPSARRAFVWPALVALAVSALLAIWLGPWAAPILLVGLLLAGVAAWARIPAEQAIPRVVALLLAALVVEAAILIHYSG